jgi:hypothetical protein
VTFPYFSDLASIGGFALSVLSILLSTILIIRTKNIANAVEKTEAKIKFASEGEIILSSIHSCKESIFAGGDLNIEIISTLRTHIYRYEHTYTPLHQKEDRAHLTKIQYYLRRPLDKIDREKLCQELDYFDAVFHDESKESLITEE